MNTKKLQDILLYRYRYIFSYTLLIGASIAALLYKLSDLLPGLSPSEVEQGITISRSTTTIFEQGYYLPFNLVQGTMYEFFGESILTTRLTSVLFGFATLMILFVLLHMWHRDKIAIASVFFLATSSWFLLFARLGAPYIYLAFSVSLLMLAATIVRHTKSKHRLSLVFAAIAIPLTLYTPYMIYLVAVFAVLYNRQISRLIKETKLSHVAMYGAVSAVFLAPLAYGLIQDTDNLKAWLGVPAQLPTLSEYAQNVLSVVRHILWRSVDNPEFHLVELPMLDIFTATMTALGLYHYEQHHKLLRTRFLMYGFGISVLVLGLTSDETQYFLLAPFIYIFAATGIVTLLNQWNRIFPLNPFARTLALVPLAGLVLITSQYHVDRYFSAWALNPRVREIYDVEPTVLESAINQKIAGRSAGSILIIVDEQYQEAIELLTNDIQRRKSFSVIIISPSEFTENTINSQTDLVYVEAGSGIDKEAFEDIPALKIEADKQSNPVPFTEYSFKDSQDIIF